jgi:hypothetical protein
LAFRPPAPEDYWLASPQLVHFELSDLIEVTRLKDVVIGDLVKFAVPYEADVRRFTRGVRMSQPPGYSPIYMLVMGLRSLYDRSAKLWRESIFRIDPPTVEDEYNKYVARIKKGPELPRIRDKGVELWPNILSQNFTRVRKGLREKLLNDAMSICTVLYY